MGSPRFFCLVFFPFCFNVLNSFKNSYFKAYLAFRFLLGLILSHSYRLLAINYANIFGNFGREINGTLRSAWKFFGQSCPPPEVVLFDWSVQTDRNLPFLFQKFSFPILLCLAISNHNFGRNAKGSLCHNWKLCFNGIISFHFLVIILLVSHCLIDNAKLKLNILLF